MTPSDQKYVTSTRPINRRTAARQSMTEPPINPVVHERLAAIKARNRFGAPMAEQLHQTRTVKGRKTLSFWLVLGSVLLAASAVVLLLAGIQNSLSYAVAGALGLTAGLFMIFYGQRVNGDSHSLTESNSMAALFDEASVHSFDRMLDQMAPEISEEVAVQLTEIKQQFMRIARLADTSSIDENFTMEDRMYVRESIRRYLPDSLQSYLMVPQKQRSAQILEQGQTAVAMLLSQLDLLRVELTKKEVKLTRSTAEGLVKQQRFLESKTKP